jgi:hypothetical protein
MSNQQRHTKKGIGYKKMPIELYLVEDQKERQLGAEQN